MNEHNRVQCSSYTFTSFLKTRCPMFIIYMSNWGPHVHVSIIEQFSSFNDYSAVSRLRPPSSIIIVSTEISLWSTHVWEFWCIYYFVPSHYIMMRFPNTWLSWFSSLFCGVFPKLWCPSQSMDLFIVTPQPMYHFSSPADINYQHQPRFVAARKHKS